VRDLPTRWNGLVLSNDPEGLPAAVVVKESSPRDGLGDGWLATNRSIRTCFSRSASCCRLVIPAR
jgi:hypothetical protein